MRALMFCALALAVAAAHLAAWEALAGRVPSAARSSRSPAAVAGRRVAWVTVAAARVGSGPRYDAADADDADDDIRDAPRKVPAVEPGAGPGARPRAAGATAGTPGPAARAAAPVRPPEPSALAAGPVRPHGTAALADGGVRPPGPAALAPGAASPWPVYATRPPPPLRLSYALRQTQPGGVELAGRAGLAWSGPGPRFALRLATLLAGRASREWVSEGGFDRAGLAPRSLVQRDGERVTRRVEFDRASGQPKWTNAAPRLALALAPGAQDRWSWVAQLAAIAEARPRGLAVVHLQVAGLRGELGRWTFRAQPDEALPPEALEHVPARLRAAPLLHLVREPVRPYDLRVEAWLAPSIHHFPIALRLATPPSRWSFRLWVAAAEAAGP